MTNIFNEGRHLVQTTMSRDYVQYYDKLVL